MKRLSLLLALPALGFLAGCESPPSVRTVLQRRFAPEAQTHDVIADARTAYDAVRLSLADMGFKQTKGGPAQGFLEALGPLIPSTPTSVARQTSVKIRIGVSTREPNATELSVRFYSVEDSALADQRGMATETPLQPNETNYYEILFSRVDAKLKKSD